MKNKTKYPHIKYIILLAAIAFIAMYIYNALGVVAQTLYGLATFIPSRLYRQTHIQQDVIQNSMKVWETQLKNAIEFRSKLTHFNQQMKDRIKIAKEEMTDTDFDRWKVFVDRGKLIYTDIEKCSHMFYHIFNQHKIITEKWNSAITSANSDQFVLRFEANIKGIRTILKKEKDNIENLRTLLDGIFISMNDLQEIGHQDILTYKDIIRLSNQGWTLKDIFKVYGPASFGWLLPAKLISASSLASVLTYASGPTAVVGFGLLGIASSFIYQKYDEILTQPEKRMKYESLINRTELGISIIRLTQEYIVEYQNNIDLLDLKLSHVLLNLEGINTFEIFTKFIKDVDESIILLNVQFQRIVDQKIDISGKKQIT